MFCVGCQTKVPVGDKAHENVVILLTSLQRGNFTSSGDLAEGQNQCVEMRKGQRRETRRGERSPVCWESISVSSWAGDARVDPEYGSLRPCSGLWQSGQEEAAGEELEKPGDVQYCRQPHGRREVIESLGLGSKSEACGVMSCTGFW